MPGGEAAPGVLERQPAVGGELGVTRPWTGEPGCQPGAAADGGAPGGFADGVLGGVVGCQPEAGGVDSGRRRAWAPAGARLSGTG